MNIPSISKRNQKINQNNLVQKVNSHRDKVFKSVKGSLSERILSLNQLRPIFVNNRNDLQFPSKFISASSTSELMKVGNDPFNRLFPVYEG